MKVPIAAMPIIEAPKPSQAKPTEKASIDLLKESVLVVDYGYFPEMAKALAKKYGVVFYGTNWHSYNPTPDKCYMGKDVPGIIHVEEIEDVIKSVDLVAFFDVGDYARQRSLRADGKKVFGAAGSELIELDRVYFKDILQQAGLAGPPFEVVYGIDNLRAYLQEKENLWVKIDSKWRGIKETWFHEDWETSYTTVDELAHTLGCDRQDFRWVVEECWPGIEGGADYFYSGGQVLPIGTQGFEDKNEQYLCKAIPVEQMSKQVRKVQAGMDPFHAMWGTSGMCSTEVRVLSEKMYGYDVGEGYFLDATQRAGSPPAEIITGMYSNLPYIIRACAHGEMITPAPIAKYAAQVILKSSMAMHEHCPVSVEPGFEDQVKFRRMRMKGEQLFIIPMHGDEIIGSAVGYGRTKEEAEDQALEAANKVKCKELYFKDDFDEIHETLLMAKELGMGGF